MTKIIANTVFIKSDLPELDLPAKPDLVFSNAVIHWISDHKEQYNYKDIKKVILRNKTVIKPNLEFHYIGNPLLER